MFDDTRDGDWFRTKSTTRTNTGRSRPQCFEYLAPPEDSFPHSMVSRFPLPVSTYFGPVHGGPKFFDGYVTVLVPSYWIPNTLVWINVSKGHIKFADRIDRRDVDSWKVNGWEDPRLHF